MKKRHVFSISAFQDQRVSGSFSLLGLLFAHFAMSSASSLESLVSASIATRIPTTGAEHLANSPQSNLGTHPIQRKARVVVSVGQKRVNRLLLSPLSVSLSLSLYVYKCTYDTDTCYEAKVDD